MKENRVVAFLILSQITFQRKNSYISIDKRYGRYPHIWKCLLLQKEGCLTRSPNETRKLFMDYYDRKTIVKPGHRWVEPNQKGE